MKRKREEGGRNEEKDEEKHGIERREKKEGEVKEGEEGREKRAVRKRS